MTAYEYSKIETRKKIITTIIVSPFVLFFLIVFYSLFINGKPITKPEYWKATFIIDTRQVIGLDYEQCYEKLYKEPPYAGYSELITHEGKKDLYTPVDHSYYARFYAFDAFAYDGNSRPYCYRVYFDNEQKAIYVELEVDDRGG